MRCVLRFVKVTITGNTKPESVGVKEMGTTGNLELPAQMSLCLRTFIEMLFDEADLMRGALWHDSQKFESAAPKPIKKQEELANEIFH